MEYYLRKFHCNNFGIHDLKTNKAFMYFYPENYAKKGCNEVISFIDYYINNIMSSNIKVLHVFSDNSFSQNKNKYLWAYYKFLVSINKLNEVSIYYPIPGHSYMEVDGDFGRIELNKKNYEKIYYPSEYVPIIRNANIENPFYVIGVNFSLTSHSEEDIIPIAKVFDYKKKFIEIVKNQLQYCKNVRKIIINRLDIKISLSLEKECDKSLKLFKKTFNISESAFFLNDISLAYDNNLPLTQEKFVDLQKILAFIPKKSENEFNFYNTLHSIIKNPVTKTQTLLHDLFDLQNQT